METIKMERFYDGETRLNIEYVIIDGVLWYNYDWVVENLNYNDNYTNSYYRNNISNTNKQILRVKDENQFGYEADYDHRFISRFALHEMVTKHISQLSDINDCATKLEINIGVNTSKNNLKLDFESLLFEANSPCEDFHKLSQKVKDICEYPDIQEILNKPDIDDNDYEFEKVLDELRSLNKSESISDMNVKTERNNIIKYRKLKGKSTCPEWLSELV